MCVNAGMWFERFIIIVGGLHRDFLPKLLGLFISVGAIKVQMSTQSE